MVIFKVVNKLVALSSLLAPLLLSIMMQESYANPIVPAISFDTEELDILENGIAPGPDVPLLLAQEPQAPAVLTQRSLNADQEFVQVRFDSAMDVNNSAAPAVSSTPGSPHGAAGPKSLIAVTSRRIECLRKDNGATVFGPTYLLEMFAPLSSSRLILARTRFDVQESRFVVIALDTVRQVVDGILRIVGTNVVVAVSKTDDPVSTTLTDWYMTKVNTTVDGLLSDTPSIAIGKQAIYITMVMFNNTDGDFKKTLLLTIQKKELYAGNQAVWGIHDFAAKINAEAGQEIVRRSVYVPAMDRAPVGVIPNSGGSTIDNYLFSYNGNNTLEIIEVSNSSTSPSFRYASLPLPTIDRPIRQFRLPDAPQPGMNLPMSLGDQRARDAVWVDKHLWGILTVTDIANQTAAYWIKLDVADAGGITWPPTVADHGPIDGEDIEKGTYTYIPSLDANSKGIVAFGFGASSATSIYAGAYATIRDDANDNPGTVRNADIVKAGQGLYYVTLGGTLNTWGVFSSMCLDPVNQDCFWAFNQYAGDYNTTNSLGSWKTAWAKLCYPAKPWVLKCRKRGTKCLRSSKCCSKACSNRRCA